MVGFVNGAGPHAFVSVDAWDGNVYLSRQILPPAAPNAVRATGIRGGIRLSWPAVRDAARYEVWRHQPSALIGSTARTTFVDGKAPRGKGVRYRVRALNDAGVGAFSTSVRGRRR